MSRALLFVFQKELLDSWRDQRSLLSSFVFAALGPLLIGAAFVAVTADEREVVSATIAVAGGQHAPDLVAYLRQNGAQIYTEAAQNLEASVAQKRVQSALEISAEFAEDFRQMRPASLHLYSDPLIGTSRKAASRVRGLLSKYAAEISRTRLLARGVSPDSVRPLVIEDRDLSAARPRPVQALALLPGFLLAAAFVAGMNLANDAIAGERERGSLEPLLLNPVSTVDLVLGKWLAVSTLNIAAVVATLFCTASVLQFAPLAPTDLAIRLTAPVLLWMIATVAPLALMASALQILLSVLSRSSREGQAYLAMLLLAPLLPGVLGEFFSIAPAGWAATLPIVGQQQILSTLAQGIRPQGIAVFTMGLLAAGAAAGLLVFASVLLRSERVVVGR